MFCNYCGKPNPDDAAFCSGCGKTIVAPGKPRVQEEPIEQRLEDTSAQPQSPSALPVPPQPQLQPEGAAPRKSKIWMWILVGFVACLIIVGAVGVGWQQNHSTPASAAPAFIPENAPSPDYAPPVPVDTTPAPMQAPPQPPPAPQNPIVGQWKTTTAIGDTVLTFTDDGHYSIKSLLVGDNGVYVFSNDGTLRLQPDALFSHNIVIWNCQLSGDSLSVVDPEGAGHVYTRVR